MNKNPIFTGKEYEEKAVRSFQQGRESAYNEVLDFITKSSEYEFKERLIKKLDELIKQNEGAL